MFRQEILTPNKNFLYHGTRNNNVIESIGRNNSINVSYVTPSRNYAAEYGNVIKFTPKRPLKILVLSKRSLDHMMPYVPNDPLGKNMIAAMKKKHTKAKEGWPEDMVNRLTNESIRHAMEKARYKNLFINRGGNFKKRPFRINNNGYTRNSDEMLDLAAFSLITRIAKKMGYDGVKTTSRGTVKNNSNGPTNLVEIVFPGKAPLKFINKTNSEPPPPPDNIILKNRIKKMGAKAFLGKMKYDRFLTKRFMTAFGIEKKNGNTNANTNAKIAAKVNNLAK